MIQLISRSDDTNEVLFLPGTKFFVESVEFDGAVIKLTEIP